VTSDPFASLEAGSRASLVRSFSRADAAAFQAFYGIHADEGGDSGLIGQMLLGAAVSALLGTKLPGTGALWFEQEFIYHDPIRFGEPLRIEGQVLHKSEAQRALALSVKVSGENGRLCLEGTARVRMTTSAASKTAESQVQPGAVIVTGAGRGIGAAIAKALAASGYAALIRRMRWPARLLTAAGGPLSTWLMSVTLAKPRGWSKRRWHRSERCTASSTMPLRRRCCGLAKMCPGTTFSARWMCSLRARTP
jgi:hypothetical protein